MGALLGCSSTGGANGKAHSSHAAGAARPALGQISLADNKSDCLSIRLRAIPLC